MSMKKLVGKKVSTKLDFMGEKIEVNKLTVNEINLIQDSAKLLETNSSDGFSVLRQVIRIAAPEAAADLTDEDFNAFPLEELTKLSDGIMKFSGLGKETGK